MQVRGRHILVGVCVMTSKDPLLVGSFNPNYLNTGHDVDVGASIPMFTVEELEAAKRRAEDELEKGKAQNT